MQEIEYLNTKNNKTILIIILFIFLFFWYAQLTHIEGGPVSFIKRSFSNIKDIFQEDVQASGSSPLQNILLFSKRVDYGGSWRRYNEDIKLDYNNSADTTEFYLQEKTSEVKQNMYYPKGLQPKVSINIRINFIRTLIEFLGRIFIVFGIFLFFIYSKRDNQKIFFSIISISFLIFLIVSAFLPLFSFYYNLSRFYQQFLIMISIFSSIGLFFSLRPIFKEGSYFIVALFFILYILIFVGVIYQFIPGINATTRLNNLGWEYDLQYVHSYELDSALWFINNNNGDNLNIDNYGNLRLMLVQENIIKNKKYHDMISSFIKKDSYIYSSYTNKIKLATIRVFDGTTFSYNFPASFLNHNKNKLYNNGGSEIFK